MKLASLVAVAVVGVANCSDKIHFAFEVVRHGARTPTTDSSGFTQPPGELTAQGMRQRFLLGSLHRQRYSQEYDLVSASYERNQVYVESTVYDRTYQSGYSELMGFFPPGSSPQSTQLSQAQVDNLAYGKGMPPLKIRDGSKYNADLGLSALPLGFVSIPIFSHKEADLVDDLDLSGCEYVNDVDSFTFPDESTYDSVDYLLDDLRAPISDCFNLTVTQEANMQFLDLYNWCDVVQSREFEGIPLNYDFTLEQLSQINQTVLATLVLPLENPVLSRTMYVSKQLRKGIKQMRHIVFPDDYPGIGDDIKMVIYSAHDWTVAQHLLFLNATNGNFTNVPFASSIVYELHSTDECKTEECFWVEVWYNQVQYQFEGQCLDPVRCTFDEFEQVLNKNGFVTTDSKYSTECATLFTH